MTTETETIETEEEEEYQEPQGFSSNKSRNPADNPDQYPPWGCKGDTAIHQTAISEPARGEYMRATQRTSMRPTPRSTMVEQKLVKW